VKQLEVRGLTKRYEGSDRRAVDEVSFDIEAGETLALVGPSGCGKSTTLRVIAGLERAEAGVIRIEGKDVFEAPPQDRDIAMVFQGYALYPHMSVRDNIAFPLKMRGMKPSERKARVEEVATLLELTRLLDRLPGELSGGERQRVAMGRAIVRRPKLFLFDEPLSNLDASLRSTLRVELGALLRKLSATAIYVTHDQTEAMTLGARIAVMNSGKIEQIGSPREVYETPTTLFAASFIGTPQANVIESQSPAYALLRGDGAGHSASSWMFRPEHVKVRKDTMGSGAVSSVEHLGAETIVHCDVAGELLRARVLGFSDLAVGDPIHLEVTESAHFETKSGNRIKDAGAKA
jgi:multiple sugar transport system ATP-binding protein